MHAPATCGCLKAPPTSPPSPAPAPRSAAGEDKVSGKRITAATCTSSKVMGFLAQLLQTPYGDKVGWG